MTIHITPGRTIREIQDEFNNVFPFLKLEFFTRSSPFEQALKKNCLNNEQLIGSVHKASARQGEFCITPLMIVKELEKKCAEMFGLSVHIYRKSGNIWLETTMTDNWSLKQQNDNGFEISNAMSRCKTGGVKSIQ